MAAVKITDRIYSVGILNPNMRVFDIVMTTDYGTSYNSYLVMGEKKNVLVEACHKTYFKQYLANIREVIDPEKIDYVVLNHNEPDHSGSLAQLLEYIPNATIIASRAGSIYLKNITNRGDLSVQAAKDGDVIDIGGATLRFINAPFLHWPDSMFTWVEEEKALFSCDFLGAHYCEPYTFDYNMAYPSKYEAAFKNYYDAIFGPFKPYVLAGLEKIKDLPVELCCNSHGPVLTKGCRLEYAKERYAEWSQPQKNERLTVPVFYTSAYGNTRKIDPRRHPGGEAGRGGRLLRHHRTRHGQAGRAAQFVRRVRARQPDDQRRRGAARLDAAGPRRRGQQQEKAGVRLRLLRLDRRGGAQPVRPPRGAQDEPLRRGIQGLLRAFGGGPRQGEGTRQGVRRVAVTCTVRRKEGFRGIPPFLFPSLEKNRRK